jgi:hypothetical protein
MQHDQPPHLLAVLGWRVCGGYRRDIHRPIPAPERAAALAGGCVSNRILALDSPEVTQAINDSVAVGNRILGLPKKKHRGRKKGSKNKPKVKPVPMDWSGGTDRMQVNLPPRYQSPAAAPLAQALQLLQQIASTHISAMDSESRLAQLVRQQQGLAQQAIELLGGAQ